MTQPRFSVVTPVYDTPPAVLQAAIDSVRGQTFDDWELLLVDDCSPTDQPREVIRAAAASDPRVRVIERPDNGGIVAASNEGIAAARGEFLALLDHDDLLTEDALTSMYDAILKHEDVDYLYSDEDKIDEQGRFVHPFRKPMWSPERFRHQMYTCHLSVLRMSLVREVGGFRDGFDGSQDYDIVLRVTERARRIVHVPKILYHWRILEGSTSGDATAKMYAYNAAVRALQEHLDRSRIPATADHGPFLGHYVIRRDVAALPSVSIVIPTRGSRGTVWGEERVFVLDAVQGALERTSLSPEIVVVHDDDTPPEVLDDLSAICGNHLVAVPYTREFNFSDKCNLGAIMSSGEVIVFLNDDTEPTVDHWLEELVGPLLEPDVGMTGAKLLYSDGTLQHGGHIYTRGAFGHAFHRWDAASTVDRGALHMNREVSGVTAACAAMRRAVFEEVGGFFTGLPAAFNDVDLCHKVQGAGYRTIWVNGAELYHFESQTRPPQWEQWELELVQRRWSSPKRDPYLPSA